MALLGFGRHWARLSFSEEKGLEPVGSRPCLPPGIKNAGFVPCGFYKNKEGLGVRWAPSPVCSQGLKTMPQVLGL
jgi:hypothetical protein